MIVTYGYDFYEYVGINKKVFKTSGFYQCEDCEVEKLFNIMVNSTYMKLKKFYIFKGDYEYIYYDYLKIWKKFKVK